MRYILFSLLAILFSADLLASACPNKGNWLQLLGSGGPEVQDKRASSCYLILICRPGFPITWCHRCIQPSAQKC